MTRIQQQKAAYGFTTKMTESDCVAKLFEMYQNLTK